MPPLWAMELVFWVIAAIMVAPLWLLSAWLLNQPPGWVPNNDGDWL